MKNKNIISLLTGAAMLSQLLYVSPTIINAQAVNATSQVTNSSTIGENVQQEYPNSIRVQGIGCQTGTPHGATIRFNTKTMHLQVNEQDIKCGWDYIHTYFGNSPYFTIKLLDQNGNEKNTLTLTGNTRSEEFKKLNAWKFTYGDYLQFYHAEADWRFTISGEVINKTDDFSKRTSKDVLSHYMFKITEDGLKQVKIYQNEILLSGAQDKQGNTPSFKLKFDTDDNKIKVLNLVNPNSKFSDEYASTCYINLILIGEDRVHKRNIVIKGSDTPNTVLEKFKDFNFQYGDKLRVYHAPPARSGFKIFGRVIDAKGRTVDLSQGVPQNIMHRYDFKITKNGLQEVPYVE